MNGKTKKLSSQDKERVITWLNQKGKNHICPVCGENNWVVGDHLLNGMAFSGGKMILGGPSYPMVFILCSNCAYTRQFMAKPIGLVNEIQQAAEASQEPEKAK
ncbi:hypothetical protein [Roseibium sp. Sym1]|uniref:hypothetical protein n=1 Tax=Roseibium sp. Sym1 TaxID=3016006 RepID=UPI0022B37485|nr:hypothetical protein [Roseibium sp. Sym1]